MSLSALIMMNLFTLTKLALYVALLPTPSLFQSAICEFCLYASVPAGPNPVGAAQAERSQWP